MQSLRSIRQLFNYLAWPVTFGLIIALFYLQLKNNHPGVSQPNDADSAAKHTDIPESAKPTAPYSYANAVQRAIPSVVNIYTRTRVVA